MIAIRPLKEHRAVSDVQIRLFEERFGVSLPPDYRGFLLEHNGGFPEGDAFTSSEALGDDSIACFFGLNERETVSSLEANLQDYAGRVPQGYLPIADDPGGNLIVLALEGPERGRVCFWDHENEGPEDEPWFENMTTLAESFTGFSASLRAVADEEYFHDEDAPFRACRTGDVEALRTYLMAGGDPNRTTVYGHSLAAYACTYNQQSVVEVLLAAGAGLNTLLSIAAMNGHAPLAVYLLDRGAPLEERIDARGDTPLMKAAYGSVQTVRVLLEHGADPTARNGYDQDARMLAAWGGHDDIIALLDSYRPPVRR